MAVSVAGTQRFRTLAPVKRSHESQTRPRTAPLRLPALLTLPSHQSPSARVPAVFAILCADPASPWQTLPPARPKIFHKAADREHFPALSTVKTVTHTLDHARHEITFG